MVQPGDFSRQRVHVSPWPCERVRVPVRVSPNLATSACTCPTVSASQRTLSSRASTNSCLKVFMLCFPSFGAGLPPIPPLSIISVSFIVLAMIIRSCCIVASYSCYCVCCALPPSDFFLLQSCIACSAVPYLSSKATSNVYTLACKRR